jgi:signal transduction histidine kinase/ligand-binding sensor domain-containing protein/DNA-binding response OmpR family regulator
MKHLFPLLSFFLYAFLSFSQEFRHYDAIDGLSSIEVTDLCENEHYMWIATTDGLNRFDGRNFKVYKRENGNPNSLTENNIETLMLDSEGLLWIGLKTGSVDIYDPKRDQFLHLRDLVKGKCPYRVISIFEDSQKNIWLGSWEEGLYRLTPDKSGKKSYTLSAYYSGQIISDLVEKPKGYLWIGTYFGYYLYDLKKKTWIDTGQSKIAVTRFLDCGEKNALWCSTWNSGVLQIKWDGNTPTAIREEKKHTGKEFLSVFRILSDSYNNLYLGTWGRGMMVINNHKKSVSPLTGRNFDASLINALYRDKNNHIWIGTFGKGVFCFNPENNGIRCFPHSGKLPVSAMSLTSIENNLLLAGTQGNGIYLCDLSSGRITPKSEKISNGSFSNYILSMYSNSGCMLAGHDGFGFLYSFATGKKRSDFSFKPFYADQQLEKITSFHAGNDGRIWLGTKQNGLTSVRPDYENGKIEDYVHYDSFGRDEITGFAEYDQHHLWISSHNGLFLFNTLTNKIEKNGRIITGEIIYSLAKDKKTNRLWIGTSTDLLQIEKGQQKTSFVFPSDLLPKGAIKDLTIDSQDNLWFSIGGRIFCYLIAEKRIREINSDAFGRHTILSSSRAIIDHREQIVFGSTDYLILIDPQLALNQPDETKILLTELQIDHRKVKVGEKIHAKMILNQETEYVSSIELSYKSKWVAFTFTETGTNFYENRYQYHIQGFSESWQYLDLSYPISFSQLVPGNYTLEIRKYDGVTTHPVCWKMSIVVTPPWWKTGWFYFLLVIFIVILSGFTLFFILQRYKKRQMKRLAEIERQKKEELLHEKESFFAGLSHDLLTPFSLIVAPANDLLRESDPDDPRREKLEIITKNASFLSDIFGTILDFKRAEITDSALKEKKIEIVSFTRLVIQSFVYLAKSRKVELSFCCDLQDIYIVIDSIKIERVLYNLISNSLKYTPEGGQISVSLHYNENPSVLAYKIKDNGSGIEKINQSKVFEKFYREPKYVNDHTSQGFGLGLYVVKRFITMLNGEISIVSEPGSGTEIDITIPVKLCEKIELEVKAIFKSEDTTTLLLVEDNEELRNYLRNKLSTHFSVICAEDGSDALNLIAEYLPEIVLSDIMMPGPTDGYALCRKIKENSLYSDIFVVMLTAKSSTDDELRGYREGADVYIKKPFDSDALVSQIININHTRQKRKTQLMGKLVSPDINEIDFDPKDLFLQQSMKVIEEHLMNADFKIDEFAAEMNVSKTVLHRKFRALVGQSPNQFIRTIRLRKAVNLLRNSDLTIAEIAYLTGFNQSHYFIKCFHEVYNETPKSFRKKFEHQVKESNRP